jgi:hypothetical protein
MGLMLWELGKIGDMQLTKQEINDTQIIVTTPEKWDVVTRKPTGEGELASVRFLILPFSPHDVFCDPSEMHAELVVLFFVWVRT